MQLVKPLRPISAALANAIDDFATDLRHVEEGALVAVPDFSIGTGATLSDILVAAAGITGRWRDDQQITVTSLAVMSGKVARVSKDGVAGSTLLTYKDTLPHDLAPLLVLDASGRVRQAYRHVQERRGNLEFLKEAVKDYSPLTVRTWKTSGSKSGWMKNANSLTQGIIKAILERPDEQWLVVIHKAGGKVVDVDQAIRKGLPADTQQQVSTLTWGQHMATNLYADFPNVILAGTLFMAPSFYTALTHMAQDFDVADGQVSREDVEATMRGEHANLVLQALCRGRVRKSDGDRCQPMTAYVIASPRSGIPADLPTVFPGCKVEMWSPFGSKLTGRALKAFQFVEDRLQAGADAILYREIANSVEMVPKDFPKFIAKTSAWLSAMDDIGMTEGVIQGRLRGLRRVAQSDLMKHEVAGCVPPADCETPI
ncbi:hypothetical protein FHR90_003477 [Endobacter medicaginis]|uniref:Uncharacterized protein n=1 Tax=Endobacter medicaginis TaxID=1181271 RepID=A0A839V443_9PROT|nr:hypothetical protein [Endobacter medicaginis]MBB3175615.1 hypothetical protein [Endobacter medicaginis]MCX5477302.1 hypothetical protein [Endobacter medicaginis]NVN31924.1 hypothetical protein [Endobacter medicaginis]